MGERKQGKEVIFSGYGLTVEEGSKGRLVGLLMVDRPRPADPKWLKQLEGSFGEYQLFPMTATGERGIVCRMEIETDSQKYLRQFSTDKVQALTQALDPLLDSPLKPRLILSWSEEKHMWQSRIA